MDPIRLPARPGARPSPARAGHGESGPAYRFSDAGEGGNAMKTGRRLPSTRLVPTPATPRATPPVEPARDAFPSSAAEGPAESGEVAP